MAEPVIYIASYTLQLYMFSIAPCSPFRFCRIALKVITYFNISPITGHVRHLSTENNVLSAVQQLYPDVTQKNQGISTNEMLFTSLINYSHGLLKSQTLPLSRLSNLSYYLFKVYPKSVHAQILFPFAFSHVVYLR